MSQKTILVVDDETEMCSTIADFLKPRGYSVLSAHTGRDGIAQAKAGKPDLILLDLMLPDMDGWRVCQQLKKEPGVAHVPVIILSGLVDDKQEKGKLELGDAYLSKPVELRALLEKVKALLKESKEPSEGHGKP